MDDGNRDTDTPARSAPVKDVHGRVLNPRSCVTCRRRKVKCDKTHPCSNCTRQHIECVFPTPGRAPRKAKKPTDPRDAELLARLRRLEGVVKRMGVDPSAEDTAMEQVDEAAAAADQAGLPEPHDKHATCHEPDTYLHEAQTQASGALQHRFGRLVMNEGKSRYINNSFWANLSNEVEDLKGILNQASDEEEDASPTATSFQSGGQRHGWVFSFSSQNVDLLSLHPIPVQLETYWDIYKENVDPLVKVLHIPSLEPTVLAAASHLANLSKSFEALLFAIYYGAATSLTPEDCLVRLGEARSVLLARYKFAVEQALARANFLTTEELVVLQALVIFLICLRRNNDARVIWTLTGLVVRIAQTIGIHRDGSHFGLAPFEIEMRRRLWWQVCILDLRASDDHGCDPTITEQSFDTRMPLNVNDVDLDPQMKLLPAEKQGCTDMTFSLVRCAVANTFRRLNYIPPGNPRACGNFYASISLEDKERWITECNQKLEEKYLKHCDMTVPIYWVTATVARLMMSKMWLMIYHPFQRQGGSKNLSEETRDKLFITSLENIEYALLLETEDRTKKWGWLFKTYMQWHAFAFILVELCHRTRGELVERAWIAVEKSKDGQWAEECIENGPSGHLWRPLYRLLNKAKLARSQALKLDQEARLSGHRQSAASSMGMSSSMASAGSNSFRPRVTRAPLSAAQLQRFMSPPVYGTRPLNATHLLRSPKPDNAVPTADDNMDISLPPHLDQSPPQAESEGYALLTHEILDQQRMEQQSRAAQQQVHNAAFGTTGVSSMGYGPFGTASISRTAPVSRSPPAAAPTASFNFDSPAGISSGSRNSTITSPGISPFNGDGEIDWANWDELVRQFGMDVDAVGGPGQGGAEFGGGPAWGHLGGGGFF